MANIQRKSTFKQLKDIAERNGESLFCILRDLLIMMLLTAIFILAGLLCFSLTSSARDQYYQGQKQMIQSHKAEIKANWNKD